MRLYASKASPIATEVVRAQLKHVKEGTAQWDVEYARVLETVKRRRGVG
jgi:hypothetical protein